MFQAFRDLLDRCLCLPPNPEAPPGDDAMVFRAAPAFFRYRMLLVSLPAIALGGIPAIAFVPLIVDAFTNKGRGHERDLVPLMIIGGILLGVLLAIIFVSWIFVRLDYEKRWYLLTDRSLRVREGVVSVREITVTYANIQNISIEQGPLQRFFNIADLKVDTAGGGGGGLSSAVTIHSKAANAAADMHCARFRGVDNANAIKELMQRRLYGTRDAGLGDTDDHAAPAPHLPNNTDLAAVLEEMLAEARALRQAAER